MKILKTADNAFVLSLTSVEGQIFVNSMNETLRRIPVREYWTRMGATSDQIKATVASLEEALK
jgi:hypothetical protein